MSTSSFTLVCHINVWVERGFTPIQVVSEEVLAGRTDRSPREGGGGGAGTPEGVSKLVFQLRPVNRYGYIRAKGVGVERVYLTNVTLTVTTGMTPALTGEQ